MSAGRNAGPAPGSASGASDEADVVRWRQLLLFSVIAAVALVALAAWLGMGGGGKPAPRGGIEAGIVEPDMAEKVWTRRSEARLGEIETQLGEMRREARTLRTDNDRLRAALERDAADARRVIDKQAAMIADLERRLQTPVEPGAAPGAGNAADGYFRVPSATSPSGSGGQAQPTAPVPMIETFELKGGPQSSLNGPRSGPELVADAVAKPVSAWLPAGAHAEAIVLAGVDASAGISSQSDPRPVLMRITGSAWTAAEDGTAMQVDIDGCTVPNLGGLTIDPGLPAARGRTGSSGGDGAKGSVWHAHYYMYPLLSWIGVLLDLGCLEGGSLDIAWVSELDPTWLDDELSFLLNPEAALFANLPAQAACAADCAASSAGLPLDPLFWCAGCQGGMYPLTGNVAAHVGGVQASLLAAQRLVYRLHRAGLAWGTSGSQALCGRYPMPVMRKSQYRWQMTEPVPATTPASGCNPTGRSSVLWESLREVPVSGESFGYLLFRKRSCCLL